LTTTTSPSAVDLAAGGPAAEAAANRKSFRWVLLATLAVCAYLFAWAMGSMPILGDEAQHHRRAFVFYNDKAFPWHHRPTYDPAYQEGAYEGLRFYDSSLWHMGLAMVWRVVGGPSFVAAQAYHLTYFFALAVFTYLAAARLYGRRAAWWAWALAVSTPMNLLFGTVFYLEVPVLAFAAAAVYFLVRGWGWAVPMGAALAGMFLTKGTTAMVMGPPLIFARFLWPGLTWRRRLLGGVVLVGVIGLLISPDLCWHRKQFRQAVVVRDTTVPPTFQRAHPIELPKQPAVSLNMASLRTDLELFGVPGVLAAVAAIFFSVVLVFRAAWNVAGMWRILGVRGILCRFPELFGPEVFALAVPLLFYVVAFIILLRRAFDVRYFHPVMLFAVILGGGLLARRFLSKRYTGGWRGYGILSIGTGLIVLAAAVRFLNLPFSEVLFPTLLGGGLILLLVCWIAQPVIRTVADVLILLILAMIGQSLVVPAYLRLYHRTLPREVVTAFQWIREHTPEHANFLYPEMNLVDQTGRPLVWAAVGPRYLFKTPENEQMRLLCHYHIVYIAIHPTRRIDIFDPDVEPMGYPKAWVASLESRPYLTRVYPEGDLPSLDGRFLIYRIEVDKIPKAWLDDSHLPWCADGGPAVCPEFLGDEADDRRAAVPRGPWNRLENRVGPAILWPVHS